MHNEQSIKAYIMRYFSDDLQYDESIGGAMERKQLQKWLTNWAKDYSIPQTQKRPRAVPSGGGWLVAPELPAEKI